jgi:glycosyltransferase involved in cell wall biosynthesis
VFVRAGIDADRILIRPQSAPDVGIGSDDRDYFLFAGRLSPEKGVEMLLAAWEDGIEADLLVAGGGVLEGRVREAARRCPRIRYLGELTPAAVGDAMRGAVATLLPSLWEEPFPLVIAESYSAGTPVIAADSGTRKQTVPHGETGLVFAAGDAGGLKAAVRWAIANPAACRRLGHEARKRYESFYSEDAAGRQLLDIYRRLRHDTGRVATRATT